MTSLILQNLSYEINEQILFSRLCSNLNPSEILHIQGINGSGKTTLLRIIAGLTFPTRGRVLWHGQEIQEHYEIYWQNILYIGHQLGLKAKLTVAENLEFLLPYNKKNTGITVHQALDRVGLSNSKHSLIQNLSAGQKRRAALAKLILCNAKLWILDEPFTALDPSGVELIVTLINEHVAAAGMVILTSHQKIALQSATKELQLS